MRSTLWYIDALPTERTEEGNLVPALDPDIMVEPDPDGGFFLHAAPPIYKRPPVIPDGATPIVTDREWEWEDLPEIDSRVAERLLRVDVEEETSDRDAETQRRSVRVRDLEGTEKTVSSPRGMGVWS